MNADLAIVGAGSAGAALAGHAARAGMRVVVLDRRPLDDAGARWVNGVARWMFDEAGIAPPQGDERVGDERAFHLVAGRDCAARVVVRDHDVEGVDMRRLVARLQADARGAGAELRGDVNVHGLESSVLRTGAGDVRARYYVDASGLAGPRLLRQPRVPAVNICAAAQEMRRVRDLPAARAWFERHEVAPGDALCFTAVAGGYSILNVRLDGDEVSILTGSIPALGYPSGARILADFAAEQPWVGDTIFGGARTLPLRRPYDALAGGCVALLGDAACQVFSAHGSGVGIGLIAARMLADTLASGAGPDSVRGALPAPVGRAARGLRRLPPVLADDDGARRRALDSRGLARRGRGARRPLAALATPHALPRDGAPGGRGARASCGRAVCRSARADGRGSRPLRRVPRVGPGARDVGTRGCARDRRERGAGRGVRRTVRGLFVPRAAHPVETRAMRGASNPA